jgi:hypothetical protein
MKKLTKKAGVYFITPIQHYDQVKKNHTKKFPVKIGLAGTSAGLRGRFDQYLLCWPLGFYVFAILPTVTKHKAKITERAIHMYLNHKQKYMYTQHSHDEEWFMLSVADINNLINMIKINKNTVNPMTGKLVFTFSKILNIQPYIVSPNTFVLINANPQIGQARIHPMDKTVIKILDAVVKKKKQKKLMTSVPKPQKPKKNRILGGKKKLNFN